ncbi:MurR/RpiR family transcriptional regulator [Enterococcus thailandicus]|uniref:MurR/RpiR family transcriptional regulator n=1 Tax=Enterococcus thailandicus TaxID=417368 RepID=UPI0022E03B6C|nr:hypothetical protein [Enterococcus thailandicus]
MKKKNGMLKYFNEHALDDTYSRIIGYLMTNVQEISKLTIVKLASKTFVSPATVTRFSKYFGYQSFHEMIYSLPEELSPTPNFTYRLTKNDLNIMKQQPKKFLEIYGERVIDSINDAVTTINIHQSDVLLEKIYKSNSIYLFAYSSAVDVARKMQSAMVFNGKLLFLGHDEEQQLDFAKTMGPKSLAIIISSFGGFFSNNSDVFREIQKSKAETVLITQSSNIRNSAELDFIVQITKNDTMMSGNFPLFFYTEYLLSRYVELYR